MASGWGAFAAAFAVFLLSHALPARPSVRRALVARLGERGYLALYSLVSLAVFAWLMVAAGQAPFVPLWDFAPWQLWVPPIAMAGACLLAAFGIGAVNPLSFAGRSGAAFDPDQPGIAGVARHPLLWAIVLWAASHAVPNGDLAHVLLFASLAGFSLAGMAVIDRRKRRQMGTAAWAVLAARTSFWPAAALVSGRWRPRPALPSPRRLAAAALAYLVLLLLHLPVIGVSPLPVW